mgnify:CR=1 FL=1
MKNSHRARYLAALCILVLILGVSCKRRASQDAGASCPPAEIQFAVAPFTNPSADYQLLAGYLPDDANKVPVGELSRLDALLADAMASECNVTVRPASAMAKCLPAQAESGEMNRMGTLQYWQKVGQCARAQYLIIPQIITLRERVGSAAGVEKPAKVNLSVFVMNVETGGIQNYAHFEEEQRTLMDNVLEAGKFLERKGRWLTALELAKEGLSKCVTELKL